MSDIKISLCASANRPILQNGFKNWERLLNSLKRNKIKYEVIFVGNVEPPKSILNNYPEFKWIYAVVKPCQCYQIAFWEANGELIHWTADDVDYNHPRLNCPNTLDIAYDFYKQCQKRYGDNKTIVAFRPFEDGGDVWQFHHFFGGWIYTPTMAPFALIDRKYFIDYLGGYDKNFISGQAENDVIMRVYEDGGRVEICMDAKLWVHHKQVHPKDNKGREINQFRKWYNTDRQVLENAWVIGGYGYYEKLNKGKMTPEQIQKSIKISPKRLIPFEPFEKRDDIYYVSQGLKGQW